MTLEELVSLDPKQVRRNEELMRLYIDFYEGAFFSKPNCTSCTFNKDFLKLKKLVLTKGYKSKDVPLKTFTMSNSKKRVLKRQHRNEILAYRDKDNKAVRTYGHLADDKFVENFLKHGTKEQIAEREKMFEPKGKKTKGKSNKTKETANTETGTAPESEKQVAKESPNVNEIEVNEAQEVSEFKHSKTELSRLSRADIDEVLKSEGLKPEDFSNSTKAINKLITIKK